MLIKIIISYIFGYIKIAVEGYYIERFINICKKEKITIWKLKRKKVIELKLNTSVREFRRICKVAKKTKCKIRVEKKKGLPFLIHKYKTTTNGYTLQYGS